MVYAVLRIHLILMWIRILDPHWKKTDPDPVPGYLIEIYWIFLRKQNFRILSYFFLFYAKTSGTISKSGNFYYLSFFKSSHLGFKSKKVFFAVFGWYITPWIRIRGSTYFCVSGSRKPTSCGSNGSGS